MAKQGRPRKAKITLGGDHGPNTKAQMSGAEVVPVKGDNPNGVGQKRRENVLARMHGDMGKSGGISLRQYQAGMEIQEAYCGCEKLSSGNSDYSKPIVDSSPRPDMFMEKQVDAVSRLARAMAGVPSNMQYVIEHVCWHNQPVAKLSKGRNLGMHRANLKVALDLVANRLKY